MPSFVFDIRFLNFCQNEIYYPLSVPGNNLTHIKLQFSLTNPRLYISFIFQYIFNFSDTNSWQFYYQRKNVYNIHHELLKCDHLGEFINYLSLVVSRNFQMTPVSVLSV